MLWNPRNNNNAARFQMIDQGSRSGTRTSGKRKAGQKTLSNIPKAIQIIQQCYYLDSYESDIVIYKSQM